MFDKYPAIPSNFKPTIYEIHFSTILYYPYSWMMLKGQTTWRGIDSGCGYIVLSTRYTIIYTY